MNAALWKRGETLFRGGLRSLGSRAHVVENARRIKELARTLREVRSISFRFFLFVDALMRRFGRTRRARFVTLPFLSVASPTRLTARGALLDQSGGKLGGRRGRGTRDQAGRDKSRRAYRCRAVERARRDVDSH